MQKAFLYAILLLFVVSCEDKDDDLETPDPAPDCRLTKLIQGTHNGAEDDTTFIFSYDASGKLIKINESNPAYNSSTDFNLTYDASSLLTGVKSDYNSNTFKYTAGGQLEEVTTTGGFITDTTRIRFVYGSDKVPTKSIRYRHSGFDNKWDTTEYHYTWQNGNVISCEIFSKGVSQGKDAYEYESIPNIAPILLLVGMQGTVPIGQNTEFYYFNKNVRKWYKGYGQNGAYSVDYKTDSGRITKSVLSNLKSPAYTDTGSRATRFYFYECK